MKTITTTLYSLTLLTILLFPRPLQAETCVKYDSQGRKIYYKCPEIKQKLRISYDVTTTRKGSEVIKKEIVRESVCQNYDKGSIERRHCIQQAKENFRDKCRTYRDKRKKAAHRERKIELEIAEDMFCNAEKEIKFLR